MYVHNLDLFLSSPKNRKKSEKPWKQLIHCSFASLGKTLGNPFPQENESDYHNKIGPVDLKLGNFGFEVRANLTRKVGEDHLIFQKFHVILPSWEPNV